MNKTSTLLLGAGLFAFGLAAPLSASADADDNALAFVIGAAVGHALDDDRKHLRHPHRRHVVHVYRGHGAKFRQPWRGRYRPGYHVHRHWQPPGWARHHARHDHDRRWHDRDHRREDRDRRRHDGDDRRDDRKHGRGDRDRKGRRG